MKIVNHTKLSDCKIGMKHQIETDAYAQDIQKMIEANKCN
jgi:riboflavin synthase alpha subunit